MTSRNLKGFVWAAALSVLWFFAWVGISKMLGVVYLNEEGTDIYEVHTWNDAFKFGGGMWVIFMLVYSLYLFEPKSLSRICPKCETPYARYILACSTCGLRTVALTGFYETTEGRRHLEEEKKRDLLAARNQIMDLALGFVEKRPHLAEEIQSLAARQISRMEGAEIPTEKALEEFRIALEKFPPLSSLNVRALPQSSVGSVADKNAQPKA